MATGFLVVGAVAWAVHVARVYPKRPAGPRREAVTVVIPRGASLSDVIALLSSKGIVSHRTLFRLYVMHRGAAAKLKHGRYTLSGGMSPEEILDRLVAGPKIEYVQVTVPEGKTIRFVAKALAEAGIGTEEENLELARSPGFARRLGVPSTSLEGFLFPDTYRFRKGASPRECLRIMARRHRQVYRKLVKRHPNGVTWLKHRLRFGHREVVILASIVEKETARPEERPLVASVYLNRLVFPWFRPKLLQADPTIVYGCTVPRVRSEACRKFRGRIRRIHLLDKENPYNTYQHEGLPPTPICNPGAAALEAVLAPARTKYLYFVSRNDGTHKFSATREEHERAVWMYQKRRPSRPPGRARPRP